MALIEQQGVLEELDSLALLPRFVRPIDPGIRPLDILMPDLERSRALARLLAWRAEHHWRRGESSDALAMIDRILTLARVTSLQPMLLPRLVGAAILAMTQDQIRQALLLDEIPADLLLPLAHRLFETERALPYLASAIESERIFGHWIIQSVFTDDGHGNGSLDFAKLRKLTDAGGGGSPLADGVMNILTVFYADRVETLAQYDDAMQNLIDASRLPAQHRPPNWRWGSHTAHLDWRFPLVKVAMPALDHAIDNDDIIRLDLRATTIMLCIHAHRHQHGEWPPSLNELAPALLPALPLDPLTGVDFVYRLRPGAMALGPGYVLASPGPDGVVNIDTESDETAAPLAIRAYDRKASGSDVVFTLPPPLEETP